MWAPERSLAPGRILCAVMLALAVGPACSRQAKTGTADVGTPDTSDSLGEAGFRDGTGRVDGPVEDEAIADTAELHQPDLQPEVPDTKTDPDLPFLPDTHEIEVFIDPCEGVDCDDGDQCTDDECNAGECVHTAHTGSCDDGDACTGPDLCIDGVCVAGEKVICDDGNQCTNDACSSVEGCVHVFSTGGCEDGDPCTDGDLCVGGECLPGAAILCYPCETDDECLPLEDGDLCNGIVGCVAGLCEVAPGSVVECVGLNADDCLAPVCEPATGTCLDQPTNQGQLCDDENKCTLDDICSGGQCLGKPVNCEDGDKCTVDACDPATGCMHSPMPCNDQDPCTADICEANTGCTFVTVDCDDGNPCTDDSPCVGSYDECVNVPVECNDGNLCTIDVCNPYTDSGADPCLHVSDEGAPCDDGNPETIDSCHEGACIGCTPNCDCAECGDDGCGGSCGECDDGNDCTVNLCEGGKCWWEVANAPGCCGYHSDCVDGDPCTYDQCIGNLCHNGAVLYECCKDDAYCGQPGPCGTPTCDLDTHLCEFEFKSVEEQKSQGLECCEKSEDCTAGGLWEEDTDGDGAPGPDDVGTLDYCLDRQCHHVLVPDECDCGPGQPCPSDNHASTFELCFDECKCVAWPNPTYCDSPPLGCRLDSDPCTMDGCVDNQCLHLPLGGCCVVASDCNDVDVCTTDMCSLQYSSIQSPLSCEYNQIQGCCHENKDCADCNPCNQDRCINYTCKHGPNPEPPEGCCSYAFPCDDGNPCTLDTCVDLACEYVPDPNCCDVDADCDDDNSCTAELCDDGYCQHELLAEGCCALQPDCDDGNPCTDDVCSDWPADFGNCLSVPDNSNQCDDGDPSTINVCGGGDCVVLYP